MCLRYKRARNTAWEVTRTSWRNDNRKTGNGSDGSTQRNGAYRSKWWSCFRTWSMKNSLGSIIFTYHLTARIHLPNRLGIATDEYIFLSLSFCTYRSSSHEIWCSIRHAAVQADIMWQWLSCFYIEWSDVTVNFVVAIRSLCCGATRRNVWS